MHDLVEHTSQYNCDQCDYQGTSQAALDKHSELKHINRSLHCKGV